MEKQQTQSAPNSSRKSRKPWLWLILTPATLLVLFLLYYLFLNVQATERWVNDFNAKYETSLTENEFPDSLLIRDSAYISLQRQIAFTKARLGLTKANPIGLSVNLTDSVATLEVNGVTVHKTSIFSYSISRSLDAIDPFWLATELSSPLRIVSSHATIVKEPITVMIAPKDTLEAANMATVPDTATNIPVFFELTFNNGFRMVVLQEASESKSYLKERLLFFIRPELARLRRNLKSALKFQIPEYTPEIRIVLSGSEARTLYRAIPEEGLVAVRLR